MTAEQRSTKTERAREYALSPQGRASHRVAAYRTVDTRKGQKCDISTEWYLANIEGRPCTYCGDVTRVGCDRIDNTVGHTKANVVPSCRECNTARMDNFSHVEMLVIGKVIATVKAARRRSILTLLQGEAA